VAAIRRHFAQDLASTLIHTVPRPGEGCPRQLPAAELRKLGVQSKRPETASISRPDSEVDKLVVAILKEGAVDEARGDRIGRHSRARRHGLAFRTEPCRPAQRLGRRSRQSLLRSTMSIASKEFCDRAGLLQLLFQLADVGPETVEPSSLGRSAPVVMSTFTRLICASSSRLQFKVAAIALTLAP